MSEPTEMRIGPIRREWVGGQCGDDCGTHPAGCIYGGFSEQTAYWMIVDDCPLYHGESESGEARDD